jgi:hypothetical protein
MITMVFIIGQMHQGKIIADFFDLYSEVAVIYHYAICNFIKNHFISFQVMDFIETYSIFYLLVLTFLMNFLVLKCIYH